MFNQFFFRHLSGPPGEGQGAPERGLLQAPDVLVVVVDRQRRRSLPELDQGLRRVRVCLQGSDPRIIDQ